MTGQTLVLMLGLSALAAASVFAVKWYRDNFSEPEVYYHEPIPHTRLINRDRLFDGAQHGWPFD